MLAFMVVHCKVTSLCAGPFLVKGVGNVSKRLVWRSG